MIPVPSRRSIVIAVTLAAAGTLLPVLPWLAIPVRAALVVVGIAVVVEWVGRPNTGRLTIVRRPPADCRVGRPAEHGLEIRNAGAQVLDVSVRDVPHATFDAAARTLSARLPAGGVLSGTVPFTPLERGPQRLPPLGVALRHAFGLLEFRARIDTGDSIAVAPGRPAGELGVLLSRMRALGEPGPVSTRQLGGEWEFETLREYQVGDELRTIDWRASARRHRPVVRQFEIERATEMVLAIDLGRLMGARIDGVRKADYAMTALLDLAAVALQRGERVGLLAFDAVPRCHLPPCSGWRQLETITRELAAIGQRDVATSYLNAVALLDQRHRRRCLAVVFTDFLDEITGAEMFATLGALRKRHDLLFVAVGDPHIERVFEASAAGDAGRFERAVAAELLLERKRALRSIEELGVVVVDADPRRVSAPLLRRYLEARAATFV